MENGDAVVVEGPPGVGTSLDTNTEATLAVKVALNIRPIIALERVQGCKDCINVVPGEPQVQIGSHFFTFDHVYGSTGTPLSVIFEECVSPLVDGLFHGYNATVLAYGQTGSGKTYTMGTGYTVGGSTEGVIPQVMETLYRKVENLKSKAEFQIRVSFIEILKEEIHDLLDPTSPAALRPDPATAGAFGGGIRSIVSGKPPIQIRETTNGGITLAGVTETDVNSLAEMASCLEQGSLCRATGSTNMNSRSSRSHAIFTITVEQRRKWELYADGRNPLLEDPSEDYLCAKLHLVDLAGSERAKKTGADGLRFKEGVHINRGLLALGNVISALGDDKKRKEGGHVPYRDSKLTRLLQDSLGGNSRTVMIACVSPADSNAEETLNTLKYANRARNIQNKPTINRDPMAAEMQRMRQQVELLQAELLCARAGCAPEEIQVLKQKIAWLETTHIDLKQELKESRDQLEALNRQALESQVQRDSLQLKLERIRDGMPYAEVASEDDTTGEGLLRDYLARIKELEDELQKLQDSQLPLRPRSTLASALASISSDELKSMPLISDFSELAHGNSMALCEEVPLIAADAEAEAVAKEWEHNVAQENLDKELQELNKRLEQKEAEMKTFVRSDALVLKQHFERKLVELEEEKKLLQRERDMLMNELEALATTSDEQTQKLQEAHLQKLKLLESQIADLKKKQENQSQLLRQKQRGDEAAKRLQEEIHRIKTQKVQLQQKIKQESEVFRLWKASREKELLQLRKEGRRNEYEMHKLQALNQRQKLVLQRKTEEASLATRRLKELLERKSARDSVAQSAPGAAGMAGQNNEKALQQWLDQELEMAVRVHEVRSAYEKHTEERVLLAKELVALKDEEELLLSSNQAPSMSPATRSARIRLLESMLNTSSSALVAMASQLSEAEERERSSGGRARWQHLRSMGDAKTLLQLAFDVAAYSKCQMRDAEDEHKELKERVTVLEELLRQNEAHRKELERQQRLREHATVASLTTMTKAGLDAGMKPDAEEPSAGIIHRTSLLSKNKYVAVANQVSDRVSGTDGFPYTLRKAVRGVAGSKNARFDESDSSEGELDMDTDLSDEEWDEDLERQAAKRNRAMAERDRYRHSRAGSRSLNLEQKPNDYAHAPCQEEESLGVLLSRRSSGENNPEDNEYKSKGRSCCSCSQSSGCKTKKCECKAAGSVCGHECGCKAARCANREIVALEAESSMVASIQVEVAEALETAGVDQAHRRFSDSNEGIKGRGEPIASRSATGAALSEEKGASPGEAEQVLAVQGATLLEKAWKEEQEGGGGARVDTGQQPSDQIGGKYGERRPLKDIGNAKIAPRNRPIAKQRRRAFIQLIPAEPLSNVPPPNAAVSGIAATASALAAATAAVGLSTNEETLAATPMELVTPHWRQQSLQRRTNSHSSPQLSPLRLRENKAGFHLGGSAGGSADDNGGPKKPGNGPGSPSGHGRGIKDEKENIQRNSLV